MEFKEKYTNEKEKEKPEEKGKIVLSNDAFALGEVLEELRQKLEHLRISGLTK